MLILSWMVSGMIGARVIVLQPSLVEGQSWRRVAAAYFIDKHFFHHDLPQRGGTVRSGVEVVLRILSCLIARDTIHGMCRGWSPSILGAILGLLSISWSMIVQVIASTPCKGSLHYALYWMSSKSNVHIFSFLTGFILPGGIFTYFMASKKLFGPIGVVSLLLARHRRNLGLQGILS